MRTVELYPPGSEQVAVHWTEKRHWGKQQVSLYKAGPKAGQPRHIWGPGCNQCTRHKTRQGNDITAPLKFGGDPSKGVLLIVLSYLNYTPSVQWAVDQARGLGFEGAIFCDLPVRCGNGSVTDSHVDHCREYLSFTVHGVKPTHILTCGAVASKALLGKTVMTYQNRLNWQMIELNGGRVPVVSTVEPDIAQTNKFYASFFNEELSTLLTHDWSQELPLKGEAFVCETPIDFELFVAWALEPGAEFLSFDCETYGELFNNDFRIVSMGFSRPDCDDVFVFVEALETPAARDAIRRVLRGWIPKSGQNLRYDLQSVWCYFGWDVEPIYGDLRIEYKLTNSDGVANLQAIGQMLGIGHHKREAEEHLEKIREKLRAEEREKRGVDKLPSTYRVDAFAYGFLPPEVNARYVGRDAQTTAKAHVWARKQLDILPEIRATYDRTVLPAISEFVHIERTGMGVDPMMIQMCNAHFTDQVSGLSSTLMDQYGINADDRNSILSFFESKGIWSDKWELTSTGKVSLDARALRLVKPLHEAVALIITRRQLVKLLQSYVATLPSFVRADGRVHPSFLFGSVRSGRLSAVDPAMQTIPSRGGDAAMLVKSCFTASPGNTLVCVDYKTLEVYVAAILSGDDSMLEALASGLDFHLQTAKKIAKQAWNMTPEEIEAEYAAGDKTHRNIGKTLGFGVLYGQGPAAVAEAVGCSTEAAKILLDSLFGAYPRLRKWIEACKAEARGTGYTYAYWDGVPSRRRPVFDAGFQDRERRGHAERAAFNNRVQSTASDYCLMSVTTLNKFFRLNKWPARVVLTVHDSIIVECREDLYADVAAKMVQVMTSWPSGPLKLVAEVEYGPVWGGVQELVL